LSNPAYPTVEARPEEVIARLRALCAAGDHQFWEDGVSLLDESLFRGVMIAGHQQIADTCLLGLAVRRGGKLATFDRTIPLKAVIGAEGKHLELLGGAA